LTDVTAFAMNADARLVAVGDRDNTIAVKEIVGEGANTVLVASDPERIAASGPVHALAIDPQGRWLAAGVGAGKLSIVDLAGSSPRTITFDAHAEFRQVGALSASRDGRILVSGGDDGTIRTWDPFTGQQLTAVVEVRHPTVLPVGKDFTQALVDVAVGPNSEHVVGATRDGRILVWDIAGVSSLGVTESFDSEIVDAFAADRTSRAGIITESGSVMVWDESPGGEPFRQIEIESATHAVISADGSRLTVSTDDRRIVDWDIVDGTTRDRSGPERTRDLALLGDRLLIATDGGLFLENLPGHLAQLTNRPTTAVAVAPDMLSVGVGEASGDVSLWLVGEAGELVEWVKATESHGLAVAGLSFSPDGLRLASGGDDAVIRIWDALSLELQVRLEAHTDIVKGLSFSPAGDRLYSGSAPGSGFGEVRVWDTKTWAEASGSINEQGDFVNFLSDSASFTGPLAVTSGGRLITGHGALLVTWDLSVGGIISHICEVVGRGLVGPEKTEYFSEREPSDTCAS
jgi:WD40 repeat protein